MPEVAPTRSAALARAASLVAPHVVLAVILSLTWWASDAPVAAPLAHAKTIMLYESALLFATILVAGFVPVAYTALPLVLLGVLAWALGAGTSGFSFATIGFAWSVVAAFLEGLRAHRGELGFARENPHHPHRRYDRVLLVWLATLPLLAVLLVAGYDRAWAAWGTVYFASLVLADTVLLHAVDRVPRALLRRMQRNVTPEIAAQLGLCGTCMYVQPAVPAQPGRMVRCLWSTKDRRFAEYPETPLAACPAYKPRGD